MIEIITSGFNPDQAKAILLVWPSTGGNARSFRIRESELLDLGLHLIRYNPPSHGNSIGTYDPKIAIKLLYEYLLNHNLLSHKIFGIGHSGGGAGLMNLASKIRIDSLYLLSPILDSVESLRYLYSQGKIEEFSQLLLSNDFSESEIPNSIILETLSTDHWLNSGLVDHLDFPIQNNRIYVESLSLFLKNLFLPGFTISEELIKKDTQYRIFLPETDHWFSKEFTESFASKCGITVIEIQKAKDHFFSSSFLDVWRLIQREIQKRLN